MEAWVREMGRLPTRKERRQWEKRWRRQAKHEARRAEKESLKAQRRAREEASRNPMLGVVFAIGALVTLMIALRLPKMWWLIFIAVFVFGQQAARHLMPRRSSQPLPQGEGEAAPLPESQRAPAEADPRMARVDALCDKLLAELRAGPTVLREVVHSPEQTVQALRKSCHELARRERELRALTTPEDERRLADEHAALTSRVEAEQDAVVKERLSSARKVLDEQRRQRAELATSASRLEAEHMRLYYTLENLYTQVLRVRTADSASEDVAGAGLRQSVEQLGAEMDAVTEALEDVHRAPDTRVPVR
jgi:cytoskeletal protein RodZ